MDRSEVGSSSYESAGVSSFESVGADLGSSFFAEQPGFVGKDGDDDLGVPPPASRKTEPPNGSSNLVPASPTDVSNTATLLVDGHLFHRLGANLSTTTTPSRLPTSTTSPLPFSPPASTPAISLDLVLGHGRAADVYSDSTGLLAIKLVEPRIDDVFNPLYDSDPEQASRRYDSRLQEAMREAEAYGKLQGCRVVPAFYGAFEGVDERGYRIVVLVMERLVGKHIAQDQLPQFVRRGPSTPAVLLTLPLCTETSTRSRTRCAPCTATASSMATFASPTSSSSRTRSFSSISAVHVWTRMCGRQRRKRSVSGIGGRSGGDRDVQALRSSSFLAFLLGGGCRSDCSSMLLQ